MNELKRILVGVAIDGTGGIDTYIYKFVKLANKSGFTCDVLTTKLNENYAKLLKKHNANLIKIQNLHNKYELICTMKKICSLNKYDAAYWNISTALMYPYVKVSQDCGIKTNLVHSHAISTDRSNKLENIMFKFMHYFYRQKLNKLDIYRYAVSNISAKWMFKDEPYTFIPQPIDTLNFKYDKNKRNKYRKLLKLEDNFVVGCVTSFLPIKNTLFIPKVINELQKLKPNTKLIVCGNGPQINDFKKLCLTLLHPESFKNLGFVQDVQDLLQVFDAFILPSIHEGLATVLVEAQASGLPCVFSKDLPQENTINTQLTKTIDGFEAKTWAKELYNISQLDTKRSSNDAQIIYDKGFNEKSPQTIIDLISN